MLWTDSIILFFLYLQPPIIGLLLALALHKGLVSLPYFSWITGSRRHRKNSRFFECAARPRLLSFFTYEIPMLAFCALFILYDADLIFFLPEIISNEFWTLSQFYGLFVCTFFFLGSLWYDINRCGFLWDL